ncbi:MAG: hypothetical protein KKI08_05815 [Armatimonadetes bacterium]|nr:hypothetical protein [Armatimonadota bacterium]
MSSMMECRDLTGQRQANVELEAAATVADVAAEAVWRLQLPSRSQRNMPLDYQLRAQSGELMRPSESLQDERVRDLLTAGQVTVIPRLTAA